MTKSQIIMNLETSIQNLNEILINLAPYEARLRYILELARGRLEDGIALLLEKYEE